MISLQPGSQSTPPIDGIFRALADPTRRRVV
ncbi:MAG: transcriptional regulator, partial [Mesorhizobium sp.]